MQGHKTDRAGAGAGAPGPRTDYSLLDVIPADVGPRLTTPMGGAVHSIRAPGSQTFPAEDHFAAVMLARSPRICSAFGRDEVHEFNASRGTLVVSPAGWESGMSWSAATESVILALKHAHLSELAANEFDVGDIELRPPPFETVDPVALNFAELLKAELAESEATNELYIDSLITAFAIHLLRKYTSASGVPQKAVGGLSVRAAKMLEHFLDENFARKLSVAELAAVCDLSPRHFIRAFTRTFGERPHKYLLDRRLAFAEKLLVESNLTIAEIAQLSGFSSQSHLTAIMTKFRRTTPARLRHGR